MATQMQSIIFTLSFFAVWILTTFFGGLAGFVLGWMPAFWIAFGIAYFADWLLIIGVFVLIGVYITNHV